MPGKGGQHRRNKGSGCAGINIVYADIYKLLTLLKNPEDIDEIFLQLVGKILFLNYGTLDLSEGHMIQANELLKTCKLYHEIISDSTFLNSRVFHFYDKEYGTTYYSDIRSCFEYFAYSLVGEDVQKWNKQVRFLIVDPHEKYDKGKIENIF